MNLWKIYTMEDEYPGLWQQWYRQQCVAVGFAPHWGCKLRGTTEDFGGWHRCRKALLEMQIGDHVVAALPEHRVGRLGTIVEKRIEDDEWDPLVPPNKNDPPGSMGRRIYVRWDLTCGPEDRDLVVALPEDGRFANYERLPTVARIRSLSLVKLRAAMNMKENWIGLLSHFAYERALSDYIGAYPYHLEDGLMPYPSSKVREKVLSEGKRGKSPRKRLRLDVLLLDRKRRPVIVECKQGTPLAKHIEQLRTYMRRFQRQTRRDDVRGILVHGGAQRIRADVARAAAAHPRVELVQYRLHVEFAGRH